MFCLPSLEASQDMVGLGEEPEAKAELGESEYPSSPHDAPFSATH